MRKEAAHSFAVRKPLMKKPVMKKQTELAFLSKFQLLITSYMRDLTSWITNKVNFNKSRYFKQCLIFLTYDFIPTALYYSSNLSYKIYCHEQPIICISVCFERHQTYFNYPCFQSQFTFNLDHLIPHCIREEKNLFFDKTCIHWNFKILLLSQLFFVFFLTRVRIDLNWNFSLGP